MDRGTDWLYGVPVERLSALTGTHLSTARRWKKKRRCPRWLQRVIRLCVLGELGEIHRAWDGWVIRDQYLVSPEGWRFSFGEIRAIPFMHAQIRTYQRLQRCIQQADWIEQRYVDAGELPEASAG